MRGKLEEGQTRRAHAGRIVCDQCRRLGKARRNAELASRRMQMGEAAYRGFIISSEAPPFALLGSGLLPHWTS